MGWSEVADNDPVPKLRKPTVSLSFLNMSVMDFFSLLENLSLGLRE